MNLIDFWVFGLDLGVDWFAGRFGVIWMVDWGGFPGLVGGTFRGIWV